MPRHAPSDSASNLPPPAWPPFPSHNGIIHAESVPLPLLATAYSTPTYIYSRAAITHNATAFSAALSNLTPTPLICYAVKANGHLAILQLLFSLGYGFDAVSEGELRRVLRACGPAAAAVTIFSGVGKTDGEIEFALTRRVRYVCVESAEELWAVRDIASRLGNGPAPVAARVNPDVDALTHPHISTGLKENKFGVPMGQAAALLARAHADVNLNVVGVSCHIGSQISTLAPFVDAAQRVASLAGQLLAAGIPLAHVGMGGGLGISYQDEKVPEIAEYGRIVAEQLGHLGLQVVLEPGRVLVGDAGVLLCRVVRTKTGEGGRRFVVIDGGMNDLLRPALYGAHHRVEAVNQGLAEVRGPLQRQDVVGPVCESADTFVTGESLPPLRAGDLVAVRTVGAYGSVMASNYNGRPRAAEVMVDGQKSWIIRSKEEIADLWRGEVGLDGLPPDEAP